MIFLDGLNSIIESIYLNEEISSKPGNSTIFINPGNVKYIIGKIVIISSIDYPSEKIEKLISNNCKIISRISTENPRVELAPYILRLDFNIMWNGRTINNFETMNKILEDDDCSFDIGSGILYFPKLSYIPQEAMDNLGNLSSLGWVLQQVGVNVKEDTPFKNLDILKTKKIVF